MVYYGIRYLIKVMRKDIATRFKPQPNSLARTAIAVKLDKTTDAIVRSIPDRSQWLRAAIIEKLTREGLHETQKEES